MLIDRRELLRGEERRGEARRGEKRRGEVRVQNEERLIVSIKMVARSNKRKKGSQTFDEMRE